MVGGGNTALEDALFLSGYCRKVYLIHRRDRLRGEERLEESLRQKENVEWVLESRVVRLNGTERLESIAIDHKGVEEELQVPALFVAVGQEPDNRAFLSAEELDAGGYFAAGEDCCTAAPGIFIAGDCRAKRIRQITTAAADGSVAALAACTYLDSLS